MNPRLTFNEEEKLWNLETPIALNINQVNGVIKYTMEIYKKRLNGTIGERRKNIEYALKLLTPKNIKQKLIGAEPTLFYSGKF